MKEECKLVLLLAGEENSNSCLYSISTLQYFKALEHYSSKYFLKLDFLFMVGIFQFTLNKHLST